MFSVSLLLCDVTGAMLVIAHAFTVMGKKYEDVPGKKPVCHDDTHHH